MVLVKYQFQQSNLEILFILWLSIDLNAVYVFFYFLTFLKFLLHLYIGKFNLAGYLSFYIVFF